MKLSAEARQLALALWEEQLRLGIGEEGEVVDEELLYAWLDNRAYPLSLLEEAAQGDVAALVEVRLEAGLPALC